MAANATSDVTQKVGEQAERALITIEKIELAPVYPPTHKIRLLGRCKVSGKSPAFNIDVYGSLSVRPTCEDERICPLIFTNAPYIPSSNKELPYTFTFPITPKYGAYINRSSETCLLTVEIIVVYNDVFTIGTDRKRNRAQYNFQTLFQPDTHCDFDAFGRVQIDRVERSYRTYLHVDAAADATRDAGWQGFS